MNRYILIRRLRGPAILLLIGVIALLHQTGVIDHFWHWFIPMVLILLGLLMLAERTEPIPPYPGSPYSGSPYPGTPYPGSPYPGAPYPGAPYTGPVDPGAAPGVATSQETAIVPARDYNKPNGGQS
jgi:hypothetical protein